ncbi:hypothetical protein ACWEU6_28135 [Streptosporangium sandarakinum]|uniref:hypothetical protein n=1 Tax=Streptosporangium sandarakinum TaxID=1260955 RepID=UPI003680FD65
MTESADLMRQAEAKDMLADRFDGYAKNLELLLERIKTGSLGGPVWTGPAAQRFDNDFLTRGSEVTRLAEQCHAAVRNLRRAASRLREQASLPRSPL